MNRLLCVLFIPALMLAACTGENGQLQRAEERIDSLQERLDRSRARFDSLSMLATGGEFNPWFHRSLDGRRFRQMGITDPEEYIRRALRERTELIPLDPVLGGTMRFVQIQVLGSRWVIAQYEDGHIAGRSIYRYELGPDGKLEFELLLSSRL